MVLWNSFPLMSQQTYGKGEVENVFNQIFFQRPKAQAQKQDPGTGDWNPLTFICYVILDNFCKPLLPICEWW